MSNEREQREREQAIIADLQQQGDNIIAPARMLAGIVERYTEGTSESELYQRVSLGLMYTNPNQRAMLAYQLSRLVEQIARLDRNLAG